MMKKVLSLLFVLILASLVAACVGCNRNTVPPEEPEPAPTGTKKSLSWLLWVILALILCGGVYLISKKKKK